MIRHLIGVVVLMCIATTAFTQNCPGPLTVTIEGSVSGISLDIDSLVVQPSCNVLSGGLDGSVTLTVTGGTSPYQYAWSTGPSDVTNEITGLGAGSYTVTVTDDAGCTDEETYILVEPDPIVATESHVDLECAANTGAPTGSITIETIIGGTVASDYTFEWTGPAGATNLVATQRDQTDLIEGAYQVIIRDDNLCADTLNIDLTQPEIIMVGLDGTALICNEANGAPTGAITTTISGGTGAYTYAWDTSTGANLDVAAADQTGLTAGRYYLTVSDGNGCEVIDSIDLAEPLAIEPVASVTDLTCHEDNGTVNGAISLTVTGGTTSGGIVTPGDGYSYVWTGPNSYTATTADISDLSAGQYTVVVTDDNGCTESLDIDVVQPDPILIDATPVQLACNASSGAPDGEIDVTVTVGGVDETASHTYTWSTTASPDNLVAGATQTTLAAGTYDLTVTDTNGCTQTAQWILDEPTGVTCSLASTEYGTDNVNIACFGDNTGDITVTAGGGLILDGNGDPIADPYTYSIDNGTTSQTTPVFNDLTAGSYTVLVTDGNGCTSECMITLTEAVLLEGSTCVVQDECQLEQGTIEVTAVGGVEPYQVTYTVSAGGNLLSVGGSEVAEGADTAILTDGGNILYTGAEGGATYTFVITDSNGCIIQ